MNRLLMETEGKYSGYKHHPNYKEGDDIRKKPKSTPRSKALKRKDADSIKWEKYKKSPAYEADKKEPY